MEALEIRGLAVDEALGAADRGEEEPAAARPLLENALEGVTDVTGGKRATVVKTHAPPQAEAEARAAVLGNHLRGEPRNDAPALDIPRQRLEDERHRLGLLVDRHRCRVEVVHDAADRHVDDAPAPLVRGVSRRRLRLPDLGIVDEGRAASKREAAHARTGDPVVDLVKERDQDAAASRRRLSNFR